MSKFTSKAVEGRGPTLLKQWLVTFAVPRRLCRLCWSSVCESTWLDRSFQLSVKACSTAWFSHHLWFLKPTAVSPSCRPRCKFQLVTVVLLQHVEILHSRRS
jgi:hypothetical protein